MSHNPAGSSLHKVHASKPSNSRPTSTLKSSIYDRHLTTRVTNVSTPQTTNKMLGTASGFDLATLKPSGGASTGLVGAARVSNLRANSSKTKKSSTLNPGIQGSSARQSKERAVKNSSSKRPSVVQNSQYHAGGFDDNERQVKQQQSTERKSTQANQHPTPQGSIKKLKNTQPVLLQNQINQSSKKGIASSVLNKRHIDLKGIKQQSFQAGSFQGRSSKPSTPGAGGGSVQKIKSSSIPKNQLKQYNNYVNGGNMQKSSSTSKVANAINTSNSVFKEMIQKKLQHNQSANFNNTQLNLSRMSASKTSKGGSMGVVLNEKGDKINQRSLTPDLQFFNPAASQSLQQSDGKAGSSIKPSSMMKGINNLILPSGGTEASDRFSQTQQFAPSGTSQIKLNAIMSAHPNFTPVPGAAASKIGSSQIPTLQPNSLATSSRAHYSKDMGLSSHRQSAPGTQKVSAKQSQEFLQDSTSPATLSLKKFGQNMHNMKAPPAVVLEAQAEYADTIAAGSTIDARRQSAPNSQQSGDSPMKIPAKMIASKMQQQKVMDTLTKANSLKVHSRNVSGGQSKTISEFPRDNSLKRATEPKRHAAVPSGGPGSSVQQQYLKAGIINLQKSSSNQANQKQIMETTDDLIGEPTISMHSQQHPLESTGKDIFSKKVRVDSSPIEQNFLHASIQQALTNKPLAQIGEEEKHEVDEMAKTLQKHQAHSSLQNSSAAAANRRTVPKYDNLMMSNQKEEDIGPSVSSNMLFHEAAVINRIEELTKENENLKKFLSQDDHRIVARLAKQDRSEEVVKDQLMPLLVSLLKVVDINRESLLNRQTVPQGRHQQPTDRSNQQHVFEPSDEAIIQNWSQILESAGKEILGYSDKEVACLVSNVRASQANGAYFQQSFGPTPNQQQQPGKVAAAEEVRSSEVSEQHALRVELEDTKKELRKAERENEDMKIASVLRSQEIKAVTQLAQEVIDDEANCHQASAHYFNQQAALDGVVTGASHSMVRPSVFAAMRTPIEANSAPSSKFLRKLHLIKTQFLSIEQACMATGGLDASEVESKISSTVLDFSKQSGPSFDNSSQLQKSPAKKRRKASGKASASSSISPVKKRY